MRRLLSDRFIRSLEAPPPGQRLLAYDSVVSGLAVSVTDRGAKSFVLYLRYPRSGKPTRRLIGKVDDLPLAAARQKAKRWRELIAEGIDPAEHEAARRRAEARRRINTFEVVAEAFIEVWLVGQRTATDTAREIRKWLIPRWGDRPITGIDTADVVDLCDAFRRLGIGPHAHNVFGHARRIFKWAIAMQAYDLQRSPFENLSPAILLGPKSFRTRTLTDAELAACWRACDVIGYPYGPLVRLLMLTACRRDEVGGARWPEIDLDRAIWVIPRERFKSDRENRVPLSDEAVAVLQTLPRYAGGPCLFSTTGGIRPVDGFSKAKIALDGAMSGVLRKAVEPFVLHDLRRTVRSRLSGLRVPPIVAECVLGHALPGLLNVYDQWQYLEEKRNALQRWAVLLREIVS